MLIRPYEPSDLPAVQRIWKECGWIESDDEAAALEHFFTDATGAVGVLGEDAESAATVHEGAISYAGIDLPLAGVTSVTTSLIGRKQGLAKAVTADVIARAAIDGASVAILGIFEQGFYDLLGFGSGPYSLHYRFDPATLKVANPSRPPVRVTVDDVEEMHRAMLRRRRVHGGVTFESADRLRAELAFESGTFGLGYRDDDGKLSHFVWGKTKGESGPWRVDFIGYQTPEQLIELLSVFKSVGDQVRAIDMMEPADIQIQDLIRHPNRQRIVTQKTEFQSGGRANAWWQVRILDLEACVAARVWAGAPVVFNLAMSDPIVDADIEWPGVGGEYVVEIGERSVVRSGTDPSLPTLTASVNAFSRMWLGVRPASSLRLTDQLSGPEPLLSELDEAFRLPQPNLGMYL